MKLTLEDKIKIIELREKGLGYETIAKQFKVKYSLIQKIWYAYELHGIEGIKHSSKNRKYSYRRINVGNYSIWYVVIDDVMEIRRILYSRRNEETLLE